MRLLKSIGPAIIVTAVVLGPGSILTSSKVGATFGIGAAPVVIGASLLMISMVALSARLGMAYEGSLGDELARRLGRPITVLIGVVLFTLVALFQSSNNLALIGGLEPLLGEEALGFGARAVFLIALNGVIIAILYLARNLYRIVEGLMKALVGTMVIAFLANFVVAMGIQKSALPATTQTDGDWLALLALIGTTFSVAGAFYQAYLVKQKGWGLEDARRSLSDTILSISILGILTLIILTTAWRSFYGDPAAGNFASVADVARQLEPLFGPAAKSIFCVGILAGGASSFLVNAMIGGTVLSDSLGWGSKLSDPFPRHLTTAALGVGMAVAIAALMDASSIVSLITFAQALTVLGIPVLGLALIYLGTRPELDAARRPPRWMLGTAIIGFLVSCALAFLTATKVYQKIMAM